MKSPNLIYANDLAKNDTSTEIDGRWVPARPLATPFGPRFFPRIRLAWRVLTGKCDALAWHKQ